MTEQRRDFEQRHNSIQSIGGGGAGLASNMSLPSSKRKSNLDLTGFIPTGNDNSPMQGGDKSNEDEVNSPARSTIS